MYQLQNGKILREVPIEGELCCLSHPHYDADTKSRALARRNSGIDHTLDCLPLHESTWIPSSLSWRKILLISRSQPEDAISALVRPQFHSEEVSFTFAAA
jgi:hypothetical protein